MASKSKNKSLTVKTEVSVTPVMNENLARVYEDELQARSQMIRTNLYFHRERGKVISYVKAGKSLDGKQDVDYGKNPVEVLADNLGISRSYAYKLSTFYDMYSDSEKFQELMDFFADNQHNLSWSHFNSLVHVKDESLREKLIESAVKEKLSVSDLNKRIADKKIPIDDSQFIDEGIDDSPLVKEETLPVTSSVVETVVVDTEEEEVSDREESDDVHVDVDVPSAKTIIKKLSTAIGKFSDKVIELVGDLTISLNGVHGSAAHKDIFKGLSFCETSLEALEKQLSEYSEQLANMQTRLTSEKKGSED